MKWKKWWPASNKGNTKSWWEIFKQTKKLGQLFLAWNDGKKMIWHTPVKNNLERMFIIESSILEILLKWYYIRHCFKLNKIKTFSWVNFIRKQEKTVFLFNYSRCFFRNRINCWIECQSVCLSVIRVFEKRKWGTF